MQSKLTEEENQQSYERGVAKERHKTEEERRKMDSLILKLYTTGMAIDAIVSLTEVSLERVTSVISESTCEKN